MKFTEEAAGEIAKKHGLTQKNINKWRFNDRIPDKYFQQKEDRQQTFEVAKLQKILKSDKINITVLCEIAGQNRLMIEKFISGKHIPTADDIIAIKKVISHLKINVRKVISYLEKLPRRGMMEEKEVRGIIALRLFYVKNVCGSEAAGIKINAWARKERDFFPEDAKKVFLAGLLTFLVELQ